MEWKPNPWQENLLWHFIRTGDYWCGPNKRLDMCDSGAILIVGGMDEDRPKLEAIRDILDGNVFRKIPELYRGMAQREYELIWHAMHGMERYLRWFQGKIDGCNIIVQPSRIRWIREALEACDAYNQHRQA